MKWEYRIEQVSITEKLWSKRQAEEMQKFRETFSALGEQGWEMVSYNSIPMTGSINTANIKGYAYLAFFKRPKAGGPL